ncbi:MAG TPA: hypothetical protein GXZ35_06965 [Acholeplasmataceae bacterium]|nr:hypothetical protein [Acholeplasmataceae bacterium]
MIYIIRKSKRSAKRNQIKLDMNEAKEFLYNIEARSFRTSEFIVYCGDSPEELDEIINYFNEDYLQEITDDVVIVYKVNGDITKYDRLRNKGATVKSIDNFREKIEKVEKAEPKVTKATKKEEPKASVMDDLEEPTTEVKEVKEEPKILSGLGVIIPDRREDIENEIKLQFLTGGAEKATAIRAYLKENNEKVITSLPEEKLKELYLIIR